VTILPLDPVANASPQALRGFLSECRDCAAHAGRPVLASITIQVESLDPLAVLESIFEPGERHFYAERPSEGWAVAGAETALAFTASGPRRFEECQRFIDEVLSGAFAVGDQEALFGGPHFFCSFAFRDETGPGEPFEAATVFVPRWQVAQQGAVTTAVANVAVGADSPVELLASRIWNAHAKFRSFDFRAHGGEPTGVLSVDEVGGRRSYETAVSRGLEAIAAGQVEKVVLARAKDVRAAGTLHPLRLLNGLRQRYPECHAFSVANGRGQSFIGASPERLVRADGGVVRTEALAGSIGRGSGASEDAALGQRLLHSEKDLREHRIVLDSILQSLSPLGLSLRYSARPGLRRLSNVQHLHTPIEAKLTPAAKLLDMVGRLHPTPAVGGTPREAAVSLIGRLESFPRGLYGGALGWVDARGRGEFIVALRSALVEADKARMYAGAGIVAGSLPEGELAETELKFRAMQEALLGG
jgi:menaquinone-specific isochorismate synthase